MDFRIEMARLRKIATITRADVAEVMGASAATVKQSLFKQGSRGRRPPPLRWDRALAKLARLRAIELEAFATEMERRASRHGS